MKTPQIDPPWKWGVWNGQNVMLKKKDRSEAYRTWWRDGSKWEIIPPYELETYSDRYGFDVQDLLKKGEIEFVDEEGEVCGGILPL